MFKNLGSERASPLELGEGSTPNILCLDTVNQCAKFSRCSDNYRSVKMVSMENCGALMVTTP